ncbi:MAG TPA: prolyl oligopeptidase family serine peptidase [Candidatus Angelobacter sp.]|jgi:prolyl oligopeptidase|nr:prolyl oligopeptidase family serine peptidase [Candidatus Angelobacter sp.]
MSKQSKSPALKSSTPQQARIATVTDEYHGQRVEDPYRWLEDPSSPETRQFVADQNAHTRRVLEEIPGRDALRKSVEQLLTIGRVASPRIGGNNYFYERRDGRQNQAVVYVREGRKGQGPQSKELLSKERPLIDVNDLAPDGTIALDWWYPSEDGRYVAFGTSPNGSELSTLQVIEVKSGKLLAENIERTRAASVAWLPDSSGFYYTRYPQPGEVPAGEEMYNRRVFFHQVNASGNAIGKNDPLVFPADNVELAPQHWPNVSISNDGHWLLVDVSEGWTKTELYLKDLSIPASKFQRITTGGNFLYHGEVLDGELYITSNEGAPRFRVFKASCSVPDRANWQEIIPESDAVIEGRAVIIGKKLFVHSMKNASSQLSLFDLHGKPVADVAMPALGSIFDLGGSWNSESGFFGFVSYAVPPTVFEVSLSGQVTQWARVESGIDPARYQVEQLWFDSKDGTRLPMFVVSRKGLAKNGRNPTLLSGYGGFNVGRTPFFNRNVMLLLLEQGGIYVDVQLRGGNEFGDEWHRDGMLEKKQNVFDDFIAAAEHLIAEKYTDAAHLAIQGGSNGGLLMGAALTQRPDLFRAVVCQVPLLDMLRYQNFQIAKLWIPEYGSSDDPRQFKYLRAYSPYHHVTAGTQYPAVLFMTAESDTRVDPMHAIKMAALLQAEATNGYDRPILLRVDSKAGHGVGKPIAKLVDDAVDVWSFLFWQLGVTL